MDVVVGDFLADGLESGPEFAAPIVARSDVNISDEDNGELYVVDLDAIGVQSASLQVQEFHVHADFLAEVEGELDDGEELCEEVGSVRAICTLEYSGKDILELVVIDATEFGSICRLEDGINDVGTYLHLDGLRSTLLGPLSG
jgi:hypothetical protein